MKRSIMSRAIPGIPLLVGGSGLMAGALLPWMTLLAGLHPLRGIIGLNGKIVFAVGAVAFIAGLLLVMRPMRSSVLMTSVGLVGVAMTVAAVWLMSVMQAMQADLARNPMTLAQPGSGLVVVGVGGVILSFMLLWHQDIPLRSFKS